MGAGEYWKKTKSFLKEFRSSKTGLVGVSILILLVVIAVFFPYIGKPEDIENWSNFQYWEGYPKHAPPCWASKNAFRTISITSEHDEHLQVRRGKVGNLTFDSYSILINVKNRPPSDIVVKLHASYKDKSFVYISVKRPDGREVELTPNPFIERGASMTSVFGVPSYNFSGLLIKSLSSYIAKPVTLQKYLIPWLVKNNVSVSTGAIASLSRTGFDVLFRQLSPKIVTEKNYLTGPYNITIAIVSKDPDLNTSVERIVVVGGCYGWSGTDTYGRDLSQGILYGVRWALIIGLLASIVSVIFGGIYGVTGGYFGGYTDEIMLRGAQIVYSIPVLPLIILLAYIFKPSIWNLIVLLIVFGWPGVALVTRSMALQYKEEKYVEAARALGAGHLRIMFMYILPQVLPYLFATIALSVPGAVLTEAGVSFLGLGDPLVLTWGKILNQAQTAGATINGYWWWVIPPGLMITLVGMTFILIGQALDTILNPRLKR